MLKPAVLLALAAVSLTAAAQATGTPAPIERRYHAGPTTFVPAEGVRVTANSKVETVSATPEQIELRVTHGTATIYVDHPAEGALILVDLPTGQADLVRDGVYTLNAETNTLTVLRGEADVFPLGAAADAKGTTTKEGQQVTLGPNAHAAYTSEARNASHDASYAYGDRSSGYGNSYYGGGGYYGNAYYGDGPGYYAGWDYPYYGYGYGYPAIGIGFGYGWGGYGYWGGGYGRGFGGRGFGGRGFGGRGFRR